MLTTTETHQLEAILARHRPHVRSLLSRFGIAPQDIPDLQQEVEHSIARGLPCFDPDRSSRPDLAMESWIFAICERAAANHHRSRARHPEVLEPTAAFDKLESPAPNQEGALASAEDVALLRHLLNRLRPERRDVVVAYDLDGLSMNDIAAALRIPINTAWNRLRLARADLCAEARRTDRTLRARNRR